MLVRVADAKCRGSPKDAERYCRTSAPADWDRSVFKVAPQKSDEEGRGKDLGRVGGETDVPSRRGRRPGTNSSTGTG